jgi:lysozyme family protein
MTRPLTGLVDRIIEREGGATLTEDPSDAGGLTKFGISQRAYPSLNIRSLTLDQARTIYLRDYFIAPGINQLPPEWHEQVFDAAVNHGPATAIKFLQRTCEAEVDGHLGPETVAKARQATGASAQLRYTEERLLFYLKLIVRKPTQLRFARGWIRRALHVLSLCLTSPSSTNS